MLGLYLKTTPPCSIVAKLDIEGYIDWILKTGWVNLSVCPDDQS